MFSHIFLEFDLLFDNILASFDKVLLIFFQRKRVLVGLAIYVGSILSQRLNFHFCIHLFD
jgi:hypothetical protein